MNLLDEIKEDLKKSQKEKNFLKINTLRLILSEIYNYEISKRSKDKNYQLTDEEIVKIIQKEAKKRKDAKKLFLQGNRGDLVDQVNQELEIIFKYIPPPASREEILKAINELKQSGFSDYNSLIRELMKKFSGRVDSDEVIEIVKEILE